MNNFLTNKTLQPIYALVILLLLLCTAPILSGPRGFGLDMYYALTMRSDLLTFYMWLNLIVSACFILLAIPAVVKKLDEKLQGQIRFIGSSVLTGFMIITLLSFRHLAWGWGLWIIIVLTVLQFVNVYLNRKADKAKAE